MLTYSFHNGNLVPELVKHQQLVFDLFNWQLSQIDTTDTHFEALDRAMQTFVWNAKKDDVICFFDIDCIPLHNFQDLIESVCKSGKILANVQRSSHIPGSKDFAAPSFFAISKETYLKLGQPSFAPNENSDVGENLTRIAKEKGIVIDLFYPIGCEKELWGLDSGQLYGYGTTFGKFGNEFTYHAFESNAKHNSSLRFIDKCKSVLS
jgi:hypothetical protein